MKNKRRAWWKRRTIRLTVPVLGGLIAFGGTTSAANILKSFDGSWRGKGTIVIENSGGAEAVVCRTNGKAAADGNSLTVSGRCGGGDFTGTFSIAIKAAGGGRYTGSWKSRGQKGGSAAISGRQRGKSLVFSIRSSQPGGATRLSISGLVGDRFRLRASGGRTDDGKAVDSVDILFRRR